MPTRGQISELVEFLPRLYHDGIEPVKAWRGGEEENGVFALPWPEYQEDVGAFFRAASQECWDDPHYVPDAASDMLEDSRAIASASLEDIKTLLTYIVQGERFCDGHLGAMISTGKVGAVLRRLEVIANTQA